MFISNHSPYVSVSNFIQGRNVFIAGCGHQVFILSKYHSNPRCHSMMKMCNPSTGHGKGHSSCGIECSCMHKCLSRISSIFQCSSSSETVGKSSSFSSSSSRLTYVFKVYLEDGCCRVSTWFCNGTVLADKGVSSLGVSSSSEELKVKHHCIQVCDVTVWFLWCMV